MTGRRGFTLAELVVGMVVLGVIGGALTRLFLSQSRFYDQQGQLRRARMVSRMAINAVGTTVFLIQRLTYQFKPSVALPGRTALWRTTAATGQADELVAPFDPTAKFRFFVAGSDTAQAGPPNPLSSMRGVELGLTSQSDRAPEGATAPRQAQVVTAVFFNNQLK